MFDELGGPVDGPEGGVHHGEDVGAEFIGDFTLGHDEVWSVDEVTPLEQAADEVDGEEGKGAVHGGRWLDWLFDVADEVFVVAVVFLGVVPELG